MLVINFSSSHLPLVPLRGLRLDLVLDDIVVPDLPASLGSATSAEPEESLQRLWRIKLPSAYSRRYIAMLARKKHKLRVWTDLVNRWRVLPLSTALRLRPIVPVDNKDVPGNETDPLQLHGTQSTHITVQPRWLGQHRLQGLTVGVACWLLALWLLARLLMLRKAL